MKQTFASGFSIPLTLKTLLLWVASVVLALTAAPSLEAAGYDNTQGDFILGFREVGSPNSILVDLGPISDFTTGQSFNLGALGSLLASTYGSDWATNPNVFFSLAATTRPQDGTVPVNYVTSAEYAASGTPAKIWPRLTQSNSNILQNKIINCGNDFNTFTAQSGTNAVLEPSTSPDAYQNFMPGGTMDSGHATQGNIGWGYFNPTPEGNFQDGAGGVDLVLVQITPGAGPGTDLGTFVLSADGGTLTFTSNSPPAVTSAASVTGKVGQAFSYQITATNSPTSFAATGLPAGLTVNTSTGQISGTPTASGTFSVTVTATNASGSGSKSVTITIAATAGTLHWGASAYSVNENAGSITVHVLRDGGSSGAATVVASTASGTAKTGTDYTGLSQTLSWTNGDTSQKAFTVPIKDLHLTDGSTRQFSLKLTSATGAALGSPATTTITIKENDVAGALAFDASAYSVNEAAGTVTVGVARTGGSAGAVSVTCATSGGTAKSGTDYTGLSQTLSWADGDVAKKSFSVTLKDLGLTDGSTRAFSVKLSSPTGNATLGSPATATVTIHENDPAQGELEFSAATYSVNETAGTITVPVKRVVGSTGAVSVTCATQSGTAKTGTDYAGKSATLSWAAGDTSAKNFVVTIVNRGANGGHGLEFSVLLSSPKGSAVLGKPSTATITIN